MGFSNTKQVVKLNTENFVDRDIMTLYFPWKTISERSIRSILSVVLEKTPQDSFDFSQRTLLAFTLNLDDKLKQVENLPDDGPNEHLKARCKQVRSWLVDKRNQPIVFDELYEKYENLQSLKPNEMGYYYGSNDIEPYFELGMNTRVKGVRHSRRLMRKSRPSGYTDDEIKIYWCIEQVEALCARKEAFPYEIEHEPADAKVVLNLQNNPVENRAYKGEIQYVTKGIQEAVFDVPPDAQIILLNFANEMSPGGGYLRGALAQEEVLLFHSDGYVSLLDLKYRKMANGYAIPEFGLAYVNNIKIYRDESDFREADMLVSACYCLPFSQLYQNPSNDEEWYENNLMKFRAFLAAAVANCRSDGSNTYLLLGPIGTGAFQNRTDNIARVFRDALNSKIMNVDRPIRNLFNHIWFVSTEEWKNNEFKKIIEPTKQ